MLARQQKAPLGALRESGVTLKPIDFSAFYQLAEQLYQGPWVAERTAAVKAVSSGHRDFVRIAIWGNSKEYCYPCGSCRQFLQEFSKHMTVLCAKGDGSFVSHKLSEMMPFFFDF